MSADAMSLGLSEYDFAVVPEAIHGPAVVLIPEYWGLVDHIRSVAQRFADAGLISVAIDLFDGRTASEPDEGRSLARELDTDRAVARIRDVVRLLSEHRVTQTSSVGVVGWCMGGSLAFRCAVDEVGADAIVGFYGQYPPAEVLTSSMTPILGVFGGMDHVYPVEGIRDTAKRLSQDSEIHRFVLATQGRHGFFNDTRETFDRDAAAWAWELTLTWLRFWLGVNPSQISTAQAM